MEKTEEWVKMLVEVSDTESLRKIYSVIGEKLARKKPEGHYVMYHESQYDRGRTAIFSRPDIREAVERFNVEIKRYYDLVGNYLLVEEDGNGKFVRTVRSYFGGWPAKQKEGE